MTRGKKTIDDTCSAKTDSGLTPEIETKAAEVLRQRQQELTFATVAESVAFASGFHACLNWAAGLLQSQPSADGPVSIERQARIYARLKDDEKTNKSRDGIDARQAASERAGFGSHWKAETSAKVVEVIDRLDASGASDKAAELRRVLEEGNAAASKRAAEALEQADT